MLEAPDQVVVHESPLFKEAPAERILTAAHLTVPADTARHEEVETKKGKGSLIVKEDLEDHIFWIRLDDDLIDPNPDQPRKKFDTKSMEETKASLLEKGQKDEIHVALYVPGGSAQARLIIISGERRFRILKELGAPYIKIIVKRETKRRDLYVDSCIANIHEAHNEMELADMCKRMLDWQIGDGRTQDEGITNVANELGISKNQVRTYLKLLELDPMVQEAIREGLRSWIAIDIAKAEKRFGRGAVDQVRLAWRMVRNPDRDWFAQEGPHKNKMTKASVRAAIREELVSSGKITKNDADRIAATSALLAILAQIGQTNRAARRVAGRKDTDSMSEAIREMPEVAAEIVIEKIDELIRALRALHERVVKPALKPKPPVCPEGASTFVQTIQSLEGSRIDTFRYRLLLILAEASDNKTEVLKAREIQAKLKEKFDEDADTAKIETNIKTLDTPLNSLDIMVATHTKIVRERREGSKIEKVDAYRLEWKTGKKVAAVVEDLRAAASVIDEVIEAALEDGVDDDEEIHGDTNGDGADSEASEDTE